MAPRHRTTTFTTLIFIFLSFVSYVIAQQPEVVVKAFHNLPARLFFFDDTTTILYHDVSEGEVWVSQDEGKAWSRADIPMGEAAMLIEHPFDNHYAFVLTKGTKHYRTEDRGKTWRSFEMPLQPAFVMAPLSFHSDPKNFGWILYQGTKCEKSTMGWGSNCHDETWYTKEAFSDKPQLLLSETSRCQFAHSSKDFKHDAPQSLIYCVAFDTTTTNGGHSLGSSRLFMSEDFFEKDSKILSLGKAKVTRGVLAMAIVSKYAVVALKDLSPGNNGEMMLYVTVDAMVWAKAQFPHASSAKLLENAYTIVESTTHSLAVDVLLHAGSTVGTLFVSNSNGTYFTESLKDTNRNEMGFVDFENLYGVEGVGLANIVKNALDAEGRGAPKQLQSRITFDDGRTWTRITPPTTDWEGKRIACNPADADDCSLHLHSVTNMHNFGRVFSSPAPGFAMGVGSIGDHLLPYEQCDTFLSTDAGVTWKMVRPDAHKYEFGDQGSIMVVVNDEDGVDAVRYSSDLGKTWKSVKLGISIRARALTTVPDSTSQKFVLLGQIARKDQKGDGRFAVIYLDFAPTRNRKCIDNDFEKWYARSGSHECIMGHKQWYKRRKPDADCYVGDKFTDPVGHEENCPCTDMDFECDYNFIRNGDQCVPAGPEPIPSQYCTDGKGTYMGSSGFRLIPGNTCDKVKGKAKDNQVEKDCSQAKPEEGQVIHQTFEFRAKIFQQAYFKDSTTILVRLQDGSVWQSSNEGYTWVQLFPDEEFATFYLHTDTADRAYLITKSKKFYYTTDFGKNWYPLDTPSVANNFGIPVLRFHPTSDYLIWTGMEGCSGSGGDCYAVADYSTDNGRNWHRIDTYVKNCAWARGTQLKVDSSEIVCESYKDKRGNQRNFRGENPLELVEGTDFYRKKQKLFDRVVGFAKFSEFLIVAEYQEAVHSLDLQVSLDGKRFATGVFPPSLRPQNHAYTILESSTKAVFMHLTTSEPPSPFWGTILKSNWNGTYFGVSVDNVNRNGDGYVDFEKMIGLDGIAVVNVVSNPDEAPLTKRKEIQTRITHNDGGSWKPLTPPKVDSDGRPYACTSTKCALHIHGFTERYDSRATYSSPSVPGLIMAVGNVGEKLAEYTESDTFLSRDAGFTWQEVHKDAHLWEFGDSGSILVIVNDEGPTNHVRFSTDEGDNWHEYEFSTEPVRVRTIVTVPMDTSRRFILFGYYPKAEDRAVAIHLDFTSLTHQKCVLDIEDPGHDDFELWSPSEERQERCLFGRQTLYHRRLRDRNCVVGDQPKAAEKVVKNCPCANVDFECEFNHVRDEEGNCVLVPGTTPLPNDETCADDEDYWYERTAYRKNSYSSCEDGLRPDRGPRHACPGLRGHGFMFWLTVLFFPVGLAALIGYWYYRRSGLARGAIRLPGDSGSRSSQSDFMDTLASVPYFIIGVAGIAWERLSSIRLPFSRRPDYSRRGYRHVPVDEDAQVLRFEDEE
ncbi:signal sequence binding protein [Rickenella mellea]|uniref:Vacuolar protein sorting/targeting protein 10 n=1 Tax=Rickenella mellea TaxID=50990 RepID=A0A4Y7QFY4_9AGAM|nr:signal sequence binding protein [Rickenella mellea]